jgi:hypothetical protein
MGCANRHHRKSNRTKVRKELLLINTKNLLSNASFLEFALEIDQNFSDDARTKGCPHCGGALHYARYTRKSRTEAPEIPESWYYFHSLCCSNENCRKRLRPQSVRYAGRSPHNAGVLLLSKLLTSGGSMRSVIALSRELNVSERTIRRWLKFWKYIHQKSKWWRKLASIYNLNGKSLNNLWDLLLRNGESLKKSFSYLILKSSMLWGEITFSVGVNFPAKDA